MANLLQVEIARVAESFTQANKDNFLWAKIPQVNLLSFRELIKDTTYRLANLENFMGEGTDWEPGETNKAKRDLKSTPKTVTVRGFATHPRPVPMSRYERNAYKDFESGNIVQGLMGEVFLNCEKKLISTLQDTAIFGAATAFTGTDTNALSNPAGYSGHTPDLDINNSLLAIRPFKGSRFKLVALMSDRVANILARHPAYSGLYSGMQTTLNQDEFVSRFKAAHRLDEVFVGSSVNQTSIDGQTLTYGAQQGSLLWIGLVDTAPADLTQPDAVSSPDGAIWCGWGAEPHVESYVIPGSGMTTFEGRAALSCFSPRGSAFAVHFDTTDIG
jgi:hypothetical protein